MVKMGDFSPHFGILEGNNSGDNKYKSGEQTHGT